MANSSRPLSPHLQVYKPQLTSILSILHRITGVALTVGSALLIVWLVAAAGTPAQFEAVHALLTSTIGKILLLAWTFALNYHLLNGIRHLGWDIGWGLDIKRTYQTGWAVVVMSVLLTALVWAVALT
jgi:succinate dehydrogenase / fumarate reductase, cytochrome b subunit